MKRLVEDFDDMMKVEDEVSVEDTKSPLEKELIRVYEYLKDKGETDIKEYEVAYQEAIEKIYPENLWWEVIDLNIFWDLFENQNPRFTIDNIISSVKPEFKKEVIDTVVTEDVEEENPLKDISGNIMEFPNGEYVYVEYADGKLYAGSATNTGIIHEYEMDYDKDFDVDKNLQDFFDKIIEENPELGEPLDESKKVCEDTVKQGNKWVNKGKDGTHGTFKTKKAADAQRRAMFANKGKKSTFGEGRKQRVKRIYESMKRKPKKNLKEAADDEIKLFMNTWANYNENGADGVITPTGWMSLDEAEEYAEKYAEYEPFINDTDNVPKELGVNEYSDISETVDILRRYEDFDDTQKEVFAAFIDDGYEVDEAFSIVDDRDYIYYEADSDADLAYNYTDEIGGVESLGRDTLEQYFDYDAFGRDLAYDFIKTEYGYVSH